MALTLRPFARDEPIPLSKKTSKCPERAREGERDRRWRRRKMGERTAEGRRKRYHNESCSHGVNEEGLTE